MFVGFWGRYECLPCGNPLVTYLLGTSSHRGGRRAICYLDGLNSKTLRLDQKLTVFQELLVSFLFLILANFSKP